MRLDDVALLRFLEDIYLLMKQRLNQIHGLRTGFLWRDPEALGAFGAVVGCGRAYASVRNV
jgi:hypothetical protein